MAEQQRCLEETSVNASRKIFILQFEQYRATRFHLKAMQSKNKLMPCNSLSIKCAENPAGGTFRENLKTTGISGPLKLTSIKAKTFH